MRNARHDDCGLRIGSPSKAGRHWMVRQPAEGRNDVKSNKEKVHIMLYTIAVVLVVLWLLGLVTSYTMGGFIHILLVVAIIMVLVNLINGRRSV
jgi:Family of unknown function (DUF5670)